MAQLRHLSVGANRIDDALLSTTGEATELEHLVLSDNTITDVGAERLLHHHLLANLKRLVLTGNVISDEHIQAIKDAPYPLLRVGFRASS